MNKMLNHAFLIYAHAYPEQLKEIINLLAAPNHYCFINVDKKTKWADSFIERNRSDHNIFLEGKDRMEVAHGGYSQIAVTLRLLHRAYELGGGQIDYFHLISGQDYPLHSNKVFDAFFERNEGRTFMMFDSNKDHDIWITKKYPSRVRPIYFSDIQHRDNKFVNFLVRSLNFVSKHFFIRPMIPKVYAGWNWFSWHRIVAEYVIRYEKEHPEYFSRFHFTNCADELIFHTLLHGHIEELNIETNNSLRYVNWKKKVSGRSHVGSPLTLNEEEYDSIINSETFFCRKIDPIISKKLKEMIRKRIQNESSSK